MTDPMHAMRPLALVSTALIALMPLGCIQDQGSQTPCTGCAAEADDPMPDGGPPPDAAPAAACREGTPPLDLLLVIDDSGSMCEEQDALGRAFESFRAALDGVDWRLAVVTTDMNPQNAFRGAFGAPVALPVPSLNCLVDGEPAVPDTADCRDVDGMPVLDSGAFDADELARRFRCMVNVGTQGDGFEKPLAAAALALDCAGPNADLLAPCGADDPQFARPGAALAVIYVGDEDDCSEGMPFAMPRDGAECRENPAPGEERCTIPRTSNNACVWYADALEPVQTFVDALRGANPDAAAVTALSLAGPRFEPVDGHPVRFVPGAPRDGCLDDFGEAVVSAECCPEGACRGDVAVVCEGPHGAAFAGNRLRAMAEAFPGRCPAEGCSTICDGDGMDDLAARLALKLEAALPPPCD